MPQTTPSRVARIARPFTIASAPVAPAVMLAWASGAWDPNRPYLALMAFTIGLCSAMAAGIVWALAACHLAVAKAFAAGLTVGRQGVPTAPLRPAARPVRVDLRAVK